MKEYPKVTLYNKPHVRDLLGKTEWLPLYTQEAAKNKVEGRLYTGLLGTELSRVKISRVGIDMISSP